MRIVITGATGLIGRNLLFEFVKREFNDPQDLNIIVLGRPLGGMPIRKRVHRILLEDGLEYIDPGRTGLAKLKDICGTGVKALSIDIGKDGLGLSDEDYRELKKAPIDIFFHLAASTDLRPTPAVEKTLLNENIEGTRRILELVSTLDVREFCYTGTAYSCGFAEGKIAPDYVNSSGRFRNPYEKSKLAGELQVRDFAKKTKVRCRYFRPSVTCGRLLEAPTGAINKFDVFYGWASFFYQIKKKRSPGSKDLFSDPIDMDMRIRYNPASGLNIVPADFAAKVMYEVCRQDDPGESYYLVNDEAVPHDLYISIMLKTLNVSGVRQTDTIPSDMNECEKLYYKTVGKVFTPYITPEPILFDVSNLKSVLKNAGLSCPSVDNERFTLLMEYAKKKEFGFGGQ